MVRDKRIFFYLLAAVVIMGGVALGSFKMRSAAAAPGLKAVNADDPNAYWAREHLGITKAVSWPSLNNQIADRQIADQAAEGFSYQPIVFNKLNFPDYYLPASVTLCGEIVPLQNNFVRERLEYEFLHIVNNRSQVRLWQRRAARYFPIIEARLKKAGLPDDLKYLAVAESDLRPSVISPSGALGLWQFMPATARRFGLDVSKTVDERHLPEPLLDIGITYLSELYGRFGRWSLAMAAYNCGEGCVGRNIKSQNVNDYFQLNLPRETERYVYRIAAIKIIMNDQAAYGFRGDIPAVWRQAIVYDETKAVFSPAVTWVQLTKLTGSDYKTIRRLNPHLSGSALSGGPVRLRLPPGGAKALAQKLH